MDEFEIAEHTVENSQGVLLYGQGIHLDQVINDLIHGATEVVHHQTDAGGPVHVLVQEGVPDKCNVLIATHLSALSKDLDLPDHRLGHGI